MIEMALLLFITLVRFWIDVKYYKKSALILNLSSSAQKSKAKHGSHSSTIIKSIPANTAAGMRALSSKFSPCKVQSK